MAKGKRGDQYCKVTSLLIRKQKISGFTQHEEATYANERRVKGFCDFFLEGMVILIAVAKLFGDTGPRNLNVQNYPSVLFCLLF